MNYKVTIALVVVLLVGMAVVVIVGDTPPVEVGPTGLWPDFVATDVSRVTWNSKKGQVCIRRSTDDPGSWEVLAGETWVPAEMNPVDEVMNQLSRVEVLHRTPGDDVDAGFRSEAGLVISEQGVSLTLRDQEIRLVFGGAALGRDAIYAAREDQEDVLVISDDLQETLLDFTLDELRRRRLFRFAVDDLDRFTVEFGPETVLAAVRHPENRFVWWAEKPYAGYLSEDIEGRYLASILLMEVADFVSDAPDVAALESAGLTKPTWRVTIRKGRGTNVTRVLLVGAAVADKPGHVYFMVEGQPFLYSGKGKELVEQLERDPRELRDRNLSRLGWEQLGRVRGEYGDAVFRIDRDEGVWTIAEPEGMTADAASVEDWFTVVREFEIREFIDDPDLAKLGLEEPAGRLTFWRPAGRNEDQGKMVLSIHIGNRTEDGVYVRRTFQEGTAFLVGPEFLDLLTPGAWQFRAKGIFAFRPRGMAATRIEKRGVALDYVTEFTDGKWTAEAVADRVNGYASAILNLSALRWAGPATGQEAEYGLGETPEGMVSITFGAGAEAKEYGLVIGKKATGGRFARAIRDGKPGEAVFVLPAAMEPLVFVPLTAPVRPPDKVPEKSPEKVPEKPEEKTPEEDGSTEEKGK